MVEDIPLESQYLSVITFGEIRKVIERQAQHSKKEKLIIWLEHELSKYFHGRILDINHEVSERWGLLLAQNKESVSAVDALLAATAIHYDLCMATRNDKDFHFIGLQVFNPWNYE